MSHLSGNQAQNTKLWELTPYEIQRKPQEIITDHTEIGISPRSLHNELMCPICLDMLRNTQTTKECLHRFCSECITTALRSGNKECPTCRKKLVSRRSLRSDPNFDSLIDKIYPDRMEYEALQEEVLQKITVHHNQHALSASIEEGLRTQAQARTKSAKKSEVRTGRDNQSSSQQQQPKSNENGKDNNNSNGVSRRTTDPNRGDEDVSTSSNGDLHNGKKKNVGESTGSSSKEQHPSGYQSSQNVDADLRPHPNQMGSKPEQLVRKISTVSHATLHHVSHYLTLRIMMEKSPESGNVTNDCRQAEARSDGDPEFKLFMRCGDDDSLLELDYTETLQSLQDNRWKGDSRMQIFYLKKILG